LPESKNTLKRICKAHEHGKECEKQVETHLTALNFRLKSRRFKTPYAEVDLVFIRARCLLLVEVKSLGRLDFGLVRITWKQKDRLLRAREWFEGYFNCETALAFAYVLPSREIFIFNEAGEELNLKNEN
jgi:Holliday junction resolvase-like predicted endonuclease